MESNSATKANRDDAPWKPPTLALGDDLPELQEDQIERVQDTSHSTAQGSEQIQDLNLGIIRPPNDPIEGADAVTELSELSSGHLFSEATSQLREDRWDASEAILPTIEESIPSSLASLVDEISPGEPGEVLDIRANRPAELIKQLLDNIMGVHPERSSSFKSEHVAEAFAPNQHQLLVPWHFEFSWNFGQLNFAGDEFIIGSMPSSSTKADATMSEGQQTNFSTRVQDVSHLADIFKTLDICDVENADDIYSKEANHNSQVSPEVYPKNTFVSFQESMAASRREWIARQLLDAYWRSHGPGRTKRQDGNGKGATASTPRYSPYGTSVTGQSARRSNNSKRTPIGDNSEEGDDEDDNGKESAKAAFEPDLRFVCPYLVRRLEEVPKQCRWRFSRVSAVKDHLIKMHHALHCNVCLLVFNNQQQLREHGKLRCQPSLTAEHEFRSFYMTDQQYLVIKEHSNGSKRDEERWRDIYRLLFPHDYTSYCPSPYVKDFPAESKRRIVRFMTDCAPRLFREYARIWQSDHRYSPFLHEHDVRNIAWRVYSEALEADWIADLGASNITVLTYQHFVNGTNDAYSTPESSNGTCQFPTNAYHMGDNSLPSNGGLGNTIVASSFIFQQPQAMDTMGHVPYEDHPPALALTSIGCQMGQMGGPNNGEAVDILDLGSWGGTFEEMLESDAILPWDEFSPSN